MSFLVKTCHPNDLFSSFLTQYDVEQAWKVVDTLETSKDIVDILASPTFEYNLGTIVCVCRKRGRRLWAFNDREWVRLPDDIIWYWQYSINSDEMVKKYGVYFSKQTLTKFILFTLKQVLDPKLGKNYKYVESYIKELEADGFSDKLYRFFKLIDTIEGSYTIAVRRMMLHIESMFSGGESSVDIYCIRYRQVVAGFNQFVNYEDTNRHLSNDLRRLVPFYEIIVGVIR